MRPEPGGANFTSADHEIPVPAGVPNGEAPSQTSSAPPARDDSVFRLTYRLVEDLQRVRLSHGNRVRQVLPLIPDHVLPPRGTPSWETFFKRSADVLHEEESRILKLAERLLKDEPLGRWMLAQRGIGPSLGISILGEIWPLTRFASPRKLWAYSGLAVDDQGRAVRRRKGQRANWNSRLKTRLYLFGVSILKAGDSPWRTLYDTRKAYELARALSTSARQIEGVPGEAEAAGAPLSGDRHMITAPSPLADPLPVDDATPDEVQTPTAGPGALGLSKLQIHYRALRVVEKSLLKDLWRVAHDQAPLVGLTSD